MSGVVLWRVLAPEATVTREWHGEAVLYNEATGSTHHLNVLGRFVMATLLEHPSGIALTALVHRIADDAEDIADGELHAAVEHTLATLADLGLATSVPV